jgi:S-DNA-T family DNA segregation ATPase FtsK/SpoIIIE
VELSIYADLPHLRHPVVTDPQDAATVLKWAVLEMERRYELLSVNGARALSEFNARAAEGAPLKRAHAHGEDHDVDRWRYKDGPLPYIVVVVDELADLMLSVQAEIEKPLAQLAQKARAIGIHLIVATQRPSVNVITGLIKANFPCRIGFRVASKVDSRTILDQNGADALLGNGDMLFLPPGTSDPVRIQGAYLSTEDTESVMDWYRAQNASRPLEDDILAEVRSREAASAEDDGGFGSFEERDQLFRQAAELCVQHNQGSTSLLQRRLRVGYGRAARIIDQLHTAGILGPADGSRPREVLVGMESLEQIVGND